MIVPMTGNHLSYVLLRLKVNDRLEMNDSCLEEPKIMNFFNMMMKQKSQMAYTVFYRGNPAAIVAVTLKNKKIAHAWMISTIDLIHVLKSVIRKFNEITNIVFAKGVQRVETTSPSFRSDTERLLKLVGFEKEGIMRKYGYSGSDYIMYSKVK